MPADTELELTPKKLITALMVYTYSEPSTKVLYDKFLNKNYHLEGFHSSVNNPSNGLISASMIPLNINVKRL